MTSSSVCLFTGGDGDGVRGSGRGTGVKCREERPEGRRPLDERTQSRSLFSRILCAGWIIKQWVCAGRLFAFKANMFTKRMSFSIKSLLLFPSGGHGYEPLLCVQRAHGAERLRLEATSRSSHQSAPRPNRFPLRWQNTSCQVARRLFSPGGVVELGVAGVRSSNEDSRHFITLKWVRCDDARTPQEQGSVFFLFHDNKECTLGSEGWLFG